jgi:2-hydroxycyclohexanecarboxyl-CoA dehydrogenase
MPASGSTVGRVAVVTGGASGIGEATCLRLAGLGHRIAVLDLDGDRAERVAERIRTGGGDALGVAVDVADRPGVEEAFAKVRAHLGPTEILVTSAGIISIGDFADIEPDVWQRIIDVNLTGTFHCCQVALPDMVASRWGRIVTISSSAAQRGSPNAAHYAAAKGGVMVLTKSIARSYASLGITVNSVPPSGIDTPMHQANQAAGLVASDEALAKAIPVGHLGTPDDVAAAVAFLVSEEAGYITGQVLSVNGGSVL